VVLAVGRDDKERASDALAKLCQTYWYPLYAYVRQRGYAPHDAQDLTQEFFARLLAKNTLGAITREKGKFRSFLLMALKRFLANEWDRAIRLKRGGGQTIISLDEERTEARYVVEPTDDASPEKAFERRWALTLLDQVLKQLEAEFADAGKAALFAELKSFLSGESSVSTYAEIGKRLGMSEANMKVTVHRLRHRFRELLRLEIANTVDSPEAIDDEIRHLFAALN